MKATRVNQILKKYWSVSKSPSICLKVNLITLLNEVYILTNRDVTPLMQKMSVLVGNDLCLILRPGGNLGLDDILIKYFGSGFLLPESPGCDGYDMLVALLFDVGTLTDEGQSIGNVVTILDEICNENALYDDAGELICDEVQIKEELKRRAEEEDGNDNEEDD